MSGPQYDIVFEGKLIGDTTLEAARNSLQARLGLDDDTISRLFAGHRVIVKRGVDEPTAIRYQEVFRRAGARVGISPVVGVDRDPQKALAPPPAGSTSARDEDIERSLNGESGGLQLAPPGALLEEIIDSSPAQFPDTSGLSLVPGPDWTLEDCDRPPLPLPIPDISYLELEPIPEQKAREESS